MPFAAGGTLIMSYTNGTDRWELRIPLAEFDPSTFAYTGAGLKSPTESGVADTFRNFGAYWAPYFDSTWALSIEAVFWTTSGEGQRLSTVPTAASIAGTSLTPSSTAPPILRGFTFQLDNGERHVVRLFGIATDTIGARRAVSATSGGFDARDQALVDYLAGPATGLVAWDGQVFPPTAFAYQRYKLRPFDAPGSAGPPGPAAAPGSGLPSGQPGDILVFVGETWQTTHVGVQQQELQVVVDPRSGGLLPSWGDEADGAGDNCCPLTPPIVPGVTGGGGLDQTAIAQEVCGIALAMATALEDAYDRFIKLANALGNVPNDWQIARLYRRVAKALLNPGAGAIASLDQTILTVLVTGLALALPAGSRGAYPPLTSAIKGALLCALYKTLPKDGAPIRITLQVLWDWGANFARSQAYKDQPNLAPLTLIMEVFSLAYWQAVALQGSKTPSAACANCGRGAALKGGALLGVSVGSALKGGAELRVIRLALKGGAKWTFTDHGALKGGAKLPEAGGLALKGGAALY